jgi:hypothetical protein
MVAAASGNRRGCSTVGFTGQLTMTTAGVSLASISSTVMVSVAVIWLDANGVTWTRRIGFLSRVGWFSRPVGRFQLLAGRLVVDVEKAGLCVQLCVQSAGD